jgi:hypothetical protein
MASCKSDGIIRVVFGGPISPSIHFAGTLKKNEVGHSFALNFKQIHNQLQEELEKMIETQIINYAFRSV